MTPDSRRPTPTHSHTHPLPYILTFLALLSLPAAAAPEVLFVRGLWHREYRIEETIARSGGAHITDSWHRSTIGFGHPGAWTDAFRSSLEDFPVNALSRFHAIIICNVNGKAFPPPAQAALETYAASGGIVIFLGGRYAFGPEYSNTPLETISPVLFDGAWQQTDEGRVLRPYLDLEHDPTGRPIAGTESHLYWWHRVTPRPNARILMQAGDTPLLIAWEYQQGTVAVFTGSVMGDPPDTQLPFWEADHWPDQLKPLLQAAFKRRTPSSISADAVLTTWEDAALLDINPGSTAAQHFVPALDAIRNAADARRLFEALAIFSGDIELELADRTADQLYPIIDATFADIARKMIETGKLGKAVLGLRLAGMSNMDAALPLILRAWHGQLPLEAADGTPGMDPRAGALRLAALNAMGDLGSPDARPSLLKVLQDAGAWTPHDRPRIITDENHRHQLTALAALRTGDTTQALSVIRAALENRRAISRARSWINVVSGYTAPWHAALPDSRRRQAIFERKLGLVPDAMLPALAEAIAADSTADVIPVAFAIFAGRRLDNASRQALAQSPVPAINTLAQ